MSPEIIICTIDQPNPSVVPFSELYGQKEKITQMVFLWDYNSYLVNLPEKYFIVNGGRKLFFGDNIEGEIRILYARRNRMSVSVNQDVVEQESNSQTTSYLLGVESSDKQLLLIISEDGGAWAWKNKK